MVDDFMLDDGIIKNKGHLGEDILNNISFGRRGGILKKKII